MHIDKVGIGTSPGPGARPGADARSARPAGPKMRSRPLFDTVEISNSAKAATEADVERVGLLPQLVVRLTGRLRAAFFDRPEGTQETGVAPDTAINASFSPAIPAQPDLSVYGSPPSDLEAPDTSAESTNSR